MSRSETIYRPLPFFLIVFALTWAPLWLLAIGLNRGWFAMSFVPIAVGGLSPTLSALIVIYVSRHKKLKRDFWRRALDPRLIPLRWLPMILLFVPLLMTVAVVISTILFHFTINFIGEAFSISRQTKFVAGILFFATAICVLVGDRKIFFGRESCFVLKGLHADHSSS